MKMATVIDFRVRPGTKKVLEAMSPNGQVPTGTNRWGHQSPEASSLDDFVRSLDAHGIDKIVFTGRQRFVDGRNGGLDNDYIAETVKKYPDRIIGFASADPVTGVTQSVREIRRALEDLHLRGIAVDPFLRDLRADDAKLYPLYEVAAELGLPAVITVGPLIAQQWSDPVTIDHVAADFPTLKILLSHGCYPQVTELIGLAYRRKNVYLEPSLYFGLPGAEIFIEAAKTILQDQIIYASAFPFAPLDIKEEFVKTYDLSGALLDKFLGDNAAEFLGL
jgi:predicted TIM-barrel fold metal-dependent hydrolase